MIETPGGRGAVMAPCPSPATLGRLADASSGDPGFLAVEAHLEDCPACQGVLERLAADSSVGEGCEPKRVPPGERPPTIAGFVIERELGRGGMGVVYQAWQPQLARRVAIKVVSGGAAAGGDDRRRWLREAQAIGQVRHRNIVHLHQAGEQDGCLYLVLDLIPGGSLADRVKGPLPARVAAGLIATVTRAVDQIHRVGMSHLDVKPSNILLDGPADGPWDQVTPMLADFGIARAGDDAGATASGLIGPRGTPTFMAPEQIVGDRDGIGPRSDVFALGATLYCLLAGRPPFQAASVIETLDLVRNREPAPLRTLVPGVPRDLETIASTCLRKDPRRRYASASALADDLGRWLDGFPIRARPVSWLEHAGRWCRRRPALAWLLAALASTVASSLVGLFVLWRHAEAERARAEIALDRAVESDKATSGAVGDLVGVLATTVDAPNMGTLERFEKCSLAVRELTETLRRHRGVATSRLAPVCELERQLAEDFRRRGKFDEARTLLMDGVGLLAGARNTAHDPDVDVAYAAALVEIGRVARDQGRFDEAPVWYRRAEEVLEVLVHDPRRSEVIFWIDQSRLATASALASAGREAERRGLLESHILMLERLSARAGGDPAIGLLAALARLDLAPDADAWTKLRAALRRFPAGSRLASELESRLGLWIAEDVRPYPPGADSTAGSKPAPDPDPETHAHAVIRAIESRCEALGAYPGLFPAAAMDAAIVAARTGKAQRETGRLDDARRTAARLSAFGAILVKRAPDEATFRVILSLAFEQEAKNAWQVNDYATIGDTLRRALGEAHVALRLDPQSAATRLRVAGLQDKLVDLAAERPLSR